jgi:hypothetical protein
MLRLFRAWSGTSVAAAKDDLYSASLDQTVRRWKLLNASQSPSSLLTRFTNATPESCAIAPDLKIVVGMQNGPSPHCPTAIDSERGKSTSHEYHAPGI